MKRILIAYSSLKKHTEQMAKYVAEGVRIGGCDAEVKPIKELKDKEEIQGYDGYIFGSPTYHKDMTENMKRFLFLADGADLSGKAGGSFGSSTHSGEAPGYIYETMEHALHMKMTDLGPFKLTEDVIEANKGACQDYGKSISELVA
jgi:NAD(P)H dehydrogenase (quinone)